MNSGFRPIWIDMKTKMTLEKAVQMFRAVYARNPQWVAELSPAEVEARIWMAAKQWVLRDK